MTPPTIEQLEIKMERTVRAVLRDTMRGVYKIEGYDAAITRIADLGWARTYKEVVATYRAGYLAGGNLVRRHQPHRLLRTATAPIDNTISYVDPRIATYTSQLLYGLELSAEGQRSELIETLTTYYERGYTMPRIAQGLERFFDGNPVAANRFARTATNDIYNRAHLDRYADSGVVDGVQYSAHLDTRTSEICRTLHRTIWALDDPDIQTPPNHFNCRSRLKPYFGEIPGKRDFTRMFSPKHLAKARKTQETFRSKYWTPFPHTKASAPYQRSYFYKTDSKTINEGLNILVKDARKQGEDTGVFERLKKWLRYRKVEPNTSMIVDRYGKSILLSKAERAQIKNAIRALITRNDKRALAFKTAIARDRVALGAKIERRQKAIGLLQQELAKTTDEVARAKLLAKIVEHKQFRDVARVKYDLVNYMHLHPEETATITNLQLESAEYQRMLDRLGF